ncbi:unnamed protein product [Nippostrongylus brasiliensis]|uniref:Ubiquitin-like domain-containing protein n=1 Tax=Nippostrongylus brasiliensis TaxID=27835 RepID=A0A0N4XWT3_NIPBR|nr:hypothetical protein Q1695_009785 [Nippostrongylus brasiliensis]VDL70971.1 unnamed protein product [Nippostrongylus brasiliensis]
MADDSSEPKTVTFKIHLQEIPRITITYKDKDDLFKQFKKKVEKFGSPLKKVYWVDEDTELTSMDNPDIVKKAAESYAKLALFVCDGKDSSSNDDEEDRQKRRWMRHRSPSRDSDDHHYSARYSRHRRDSSPCCCYHDGYPVMGPRFYSYRRDRRYRGRNDDY